MVQPVHHVPATASIQQLSTARALPFAEYRSREECLKRSVSEYRTTVGSHGMASARCRWSSHLVSRKRPADLRLGYPGGWYGSSSRSSRWQWALLGGYLASS